MAGLEENLGGGGGGGGGDGGAGGDDERDDERGGDERGDAERGEKDEAISAIGHVGGEVLRTDRAFAEVVNRFVGGVDVFLGVHIAKRVFLRV